MVIKWQKKCIFYPFLLGHIIRQIFALSIFYWQCICMGSLLKTTLSGSCHRMLSVWQRGSSWMLQQMVVVLLFLQVGDIVRDYPSSKLETVEASTRVGTPSRKSWVYHAPPRRSLSPAAFGGCCGDPKDQEKNGNFYQKNPIWNILRQSFTHSRQNRWEHCKIPIS